MKLHGARRAALMAWSLSPADRRWLLRQLPVQERRQIECGLSELCALPRALAGDVPALLERTEASRVPPSLANLPRPLQQALQDDAGSPALSQRARAALLAVVESASAARAPAFPQAMEPR